ncbi:helix-turn-helix domain-containing protein [Desulfovibrio intestinalis]|uniref:Transcriptional regulator with XRE-family HTH domain n=1 Tax=Desulfovibrio intestinalis TaxID=58621 RepID=A0A7W8C2K5_9BACT|nr:helix-turn-helix transcriptional regulator [Desulfovibrio intestinalis]MBB5143039.1 transcriptional regulator with XRE-family HTH domain [Desulfovibrio intestinalis]
MEQDFLCQSFGAIIKSARLRKGLTQYQLADAAGVGRRFIQGVENGHHEAKISTLFHMANAMEVSPMVLIGELEHAMHTGKFPDSIVENLPAKKIGRPQKNKAVSD